MLVFTSSAAKLETDLTDLINLTFGFPKHNAIDSTSGLYYKHIAIVIDAPIGVSK
jgi:hypothetical protein